MSLEALLADQLVALGARSAFGVTGSGSSWKLITELEARGAEYLPAGHEAAAAIMAGGAWRATGRVAISVGIKGPGVANMVPGIAFNHFENLPVLSACEAYGPAAPAHRMHKRLDQASLLDPVCKGSIALGDAGTYMEQLLALANHEVPGPVHIELRDGPSKTLREAQPTSAGDVGARSRALSLLSSAQRPVVIVGSLASRRGWADEVRALRVPIFTSAAAKGVIDETSPWCLGVYTGDGKAATPEASAFAACDVVIGIGLRNLEVLSPKAFQKPLIVLDEASEDRAAGFEPAVLWRAHGAAAYTETIGLLSQYEWGADLADELKQRLDAVADRDEWLPPACFRVLDSLELRYSMAVDTGNFCTVAEHFWPASPERRYFGSSNGRFMGGSLPTAIGAAAADRTTPVVCVCGDGGIRMYFAEIALAVRARLPVCVILMSDGQYGSVANAARGGALSTSAVVAPRSSWVEPIERLGCAAVAPNNVVEFAEAMRAWSGEEPLYVECRFPPGPYGAMTEALR